MINMQNERLTKVIMFSYLLLILTFCFIYAILTNSKQLLTWILYIPLFWTITVIIRVCIDMYLAKYI
jgi:hypothetical protein